MADFTSLKESIRSQISSNGKQEITGAKLQTQLINMVDQMNAAFTQEAFKINDLTEQVIKGYYSFSSTTVGTATTATRNNEGSWRCIEINVVAGEVYSIAGQGGSGARLYCLVNSSGVIVSIADPEQTTSGLDIKVQNNGKLFCSFKDSTTYSVVLKIPFLNELETRINEVEREVDDVADDAAEAQRKTSNLESLLQISENSEDVTSKAGKGYYTYTSTVIGTATTPIKDSDGSWRNIIQAVKAGEKYVITGVGGGGARLYCLLDSSNIIEDIAGSGASLTDYTIEVNKAGTLYCSFNGAYGFSLRRVYTEIGISMGSGGSNWKSGSFQFGKTCNLDYTAPDINPYNFPSTGKVAYINSLYDDLVARFPKYVSRESCDDVMAAAGIAKPSAILNLPMYMYKFVPPKAPNSSAFSATTSEANMIKAFVLTGTHPEYIAVWDCYCAMKLICESWESDPNLEELRWNAEIYIIPCYNLYGVENTIRTNENGVDLNRNAPTLEWKVQGVYGDSTYSGASAGSEYSTKVMMYYLDALKPQIFIDHHNTNVGAGTDEGDGKNIMYTHSINQIVVDLSSVLFSQMTRKWKKRFTSYFPSVESDPTTIYGYALYDHIKGSIGRYGSERGSLGSTFETNFGSLYKNGVYSTDNRQNNSGMINTCATEGFVNYLLRCFTAYSDHIGVQTTL